MHSQQHIGAIDGKFEWHVEAVIPVAAVVLWDSGERRHLCCPRRRRGPLEVGCSCSKVAAFGGQR